MRILRSEGYARMPWKDGGGTSTEIAVFPEEADLADFGWRVSMATVASNSPFWSFPDVDRTLSVLEGAGMTLEFDGHEPVTLTQASEPLAFPGDIPASAQLVDGGIVNLNIMTRRGEWTHRVNKRSISGQMHVYSKGGITMLFPLGPLRVESDRQAEELDLLDSAILEDTVLLTAETPVDVFLIHIAAV